LSAHHRDEGAGVEFWHERTGQQIFGGAVECFGIPSRDVAFLGAERGESGGDFLRFLQHGGRPNLLTVLCLGEVLSGGGLQAGERFLGEQVFGGGGQKRFGFGCGWDEFGGFGGWRFVGLGCDEGSAVLFGGAIASVGVAAQAQHCGQGRVVQHGKAERAEGGETKCDNLRNHDQLGVVAGAVGVDGLERGIAGEGDISVADTEEHRGEQEDDELQQHVGGVQAGD
jgi:hypothetical protein